MNILLTSLYPCKVYFNNKVFDLTLMPKIISVKKGERLSFYFDNFESVDFFADTYYLGKPLKTIYDCFLFTPPLKSKNLGTYREIIKRDFNMFMASFSLMVYVDGGIYLKVFGYNESGVFTLKSLPKDIKVYTFDRSFLVENIYDNYSFCLLIDSTTLKSLNSFYAKKLSVGDNIIVEQEFLGIEKITKTFVLCKDGSINDEKFYFDSRREILREFIPYAFLQSYKVTGASKELLIDGLKGVDLKGFLGDFDYILPPIDEYRDKIVLVGDSIKYLTFDIQDDKICDIQVLP